MFFPVIFNTPCNFSSTTFAVGAEDAFTVEGAYAYIVGKVSNQIRIYDVSTPTSPVLKSTTSTGAGTGPSAIRIKGIYAYITYYTSGFLAIWDISVPTAPTLTGSVSVGGSPNSVAVHATAAYCYVGNIAYSLSNNIKTVDVTTPSAPSVIATWVYSVSQGTKIAELRHSGVYLYAVGIYNSVSGYDIFVVISVANQAAPATTGQVNWPVDGGSNQQAYGLEIDGNYAYVDLSIAQKLKVVLISTPASPSEVGTLTWTGSSAASGSRLAKRNNIVYRAQYGNTGEACYSADVTTPSAPTESTSRSSDGNAAVDVATFGNLLFYMTGDGTQLMYIYCLSD